MPVKSLVFDVLARAPLPDPMMNAAQVSSLGGRRRLGRVLSEMHCELRGGVETPGRAALAVGLGIAIGCLPLYGAHLLLCLAAARATRISPVKMYLAAHVNNPFTAPWLLFLEFSIGRWLITGSWPGLSIAEFHSGGLWGLGRDLMVGSLVVGAIAGAALALVAYVISLRWMDSSFLMKLREDTGKRYVSAGAFHWEFVRGKLRYDPLYVDLLARGVLPREGRVLDLGCGRGILMALLRTAQRFHENGEWPPKWPPPPTKLELIGVENRETMAEVARSALKHEARIEVGDLATFEPPACTAILMLDVLHYLSAETQETLIRRASEALEPGGTLLIREPDAARKGRFAFTRFGERLGATVKGNWRQRFHYRTLVQWRDLLERYALRSTTLPMWEGTPHANMLIRANKREA